MTVTLLRAISGLSSVSYPSAGRALEDERRREERMNLNIPVAALAVVGVILVSAGVFQSGSIFLVGFGIIVILLAWVLQEMTKRRTS
jgi:hypothetical protein